MKKVYPHFTGEKNFPDVTEVNAYKYNNDFDYSKFDKTQMNITICSVPWDVGLIHVGNAQIGGLGNVVYFENANERDKYLDGITDKFSEQTKYREFHAAENKIKVPIPYDVVARYNYLIIDYTPLPTMYEDSEKGISRFLYFIRDFKMIAPNTTEITILRDSWQTYIYDVTIPYMMLERGHAPMSAIDVNTYLSNPRNNTRYLIGTDVSYGDRDLITSHSEIVLNNENMYAVIISNALPSSTHWGSKSSNDWHVHGYPYIQTQGIPNYYAFAIKPENLDDLLIAIDNLIPQFKQTIKGIFFASEKLLTIGDAFTLANTTVYKVGSTQKRLNLLTLNKKQFGYAKAYTDIAKLYTFPYAHIEITDENGTQSIIKIEDTNGKLELSVSLSLAFPWIKATGAILGDGGANYSLSFQNVTSRSFTFGGKWYDHILEWNIPTFAVVQSPDTFNDYNTHFNREQMATARNNSYNSALASNATAKTNSDANADTAIANTALQTATNSANNTAAHAAKQNINLTNNQLAGHLLGLSNGYTNATTNNEVNAEYNSATVSTNAAMQGATVGAVTGVAGSIVSGAVGGAAAGPVGAAAGAVTGAVTAGISAAGTMMQAQINADATMAHTAISTNLNSSQAAFAVYIIAATTVVNQTRNNIVNNEQISSEDTIVSNNNSKDTAQTANNAATTKANATRDKNTGDANAQRQYNTETSAINNQIKQAALAPIQEFGSNQNGDTATTKPLACIANIVTQSKGAIAAAGDEMLRFGYQCNLQWNFTTFNVMPKFSYWKVRDMWVKGLSIPDAVMDEIRFYLLGGVCVWRRPEYIGNISIYENT